jgi:hypothetical protein
MKILLIILSGLFTFKPESKSVCKCQPLTFEEEVRISTNIFHGRIVFVDNDTFNIKIIKRWKGNFKKQTVQLVQGKTSCTKRTFESDKEYLFFLQGNEVNNCSRTSEFSLSADVKLLDLSLKKSGKQ